MVIPEGSEKCDVSCAYELAILGIEYSYPCDIIDTEQGCKPMNSGHKQLVWWELPLATTWVQIENHYLIW